MQLPLRHAASVEQREPAPRGPPRHWKKLQMPLAQSSLKRHGVPVVQWPQSAVQASGLLTPQLSVPSQTPFVQS
jgi:hypothetical protein